MSFIIGRGRYAREAYPESPKSAAPPASPQQQWGFQQVTVTHNVDSGSPEPIFITKTGAGDFLEITFPTWSDGDALEAIWNLGFQVIDGDGDNFVRAYVAVSVDNGVTWQLIDFSGGQWSWEGAGAASPGGPPAAPFGLGVSIHGSGSVVLSGVAKVIVRLAVWTQGDAYQVRGTTDTPAGAWANGCYLRAVRIPAAQVIEPGNGALVPF